jgi:coronin-1B/1C/6
MPDTHRTIGMMPKRGVDVTKNEITHFYRITNSNKCEVISAIVPRTSKGFQEVLYPNTLGLDPALSAEHWFPGKHEMPILVSMRTDRLFSAVAESLPNSCQSFLADTEQRLSNLLVKNKKLGASNSEKKAKNTLLMALVLKKKTGSTVLEKETCNNTEKNKVMNFSFSVFI